LKKSFFPSTPRRGLEMDGDAKTDPFLDKAPKEPETEAIWKPEVGTFATTFRLLKEWIKEDVQYYIDLLVFSGLFYYVDLVSDVNTLYIFYENGQYRYLSINLAAILVANLYVMNDMLKAVSIKKDQWPGGPSGDPAGRILWLGFLVPVFGHVAYLVWISLQLGQKKKHPLLLCSKVAEAGIEAAFSSGIQLYALVYSMWTPEEWRFVAISILVSLGSMAFAFAGIDLKDGLNGIPGLLKHWLNPVFFVVFTFRFAEISSRLSSLALFSVATRKAFQSEDFFEMPGFLEQILNFALLTGAPLVLLLDLLVLFFLTTHFQKKHPANWSYSIPSVLCFMNPLLECGNPFTIPSWLYFTWRWVQLFGMAGVALYLVGQKKLLAAFADDVLMLQFSAVTTISWSILLPLLRCHYAEHVLSSYRKEVLWEPFNDGQQMLWEELKKLLKPSEKTSLRCVPCRSRDLEPCYQPVQGSAISKSKDFFDAISKTWCDEIDMALQELADKTRLRGKPEAEGYRDYEGKTLLPSLYRWKLSTLSRHRGVKAEERFLRLLFLSSNALPLCAFTEEQDNETMTRWSELHLRLLKEMHTLLKKHKRKDSIKKLASENLDAAKCILQVEIVTSDQERHLDIGKHKARIIEDLAIYAANANAAGIDGYEQRMPELLEILCDERTPGLSLERSKIFGNVWRCILPEDLSDHEKISQLIWSRRWLDALRGDILRVLTSLGRSTNRLATHKEVMLEDDDEIAVTSIMDSKMQKAWVKTVRDDLIKACTVLEENAIMAGENMSEEAAKNQLLVDRILSVQTDYVDVIQDEIDTALHAAGDRERPEELRKTLTTVSRKLDSEVGFASMSGGKGSIADWKRRIMETCSKVKTNKAVATPVPSYWCEGSAFDKWNILREKCSNLQKRLENLKKKLDSGVQSEVLRKKEKTVDILNARLDSFSRLVLEGRKIPVLKISIPCESQLKFWKRIKDSDDFQDEFLKNLAEHLDIHDSDLHLHRLFQVKSCKIIATCVAENPADVQSLGHLCDGQTDGVYHCEILGDFEYADLECALHLSRLEGAESSFRVVFTGSFESELTGHQHLLQRLEDALDLSLERQLHMVIEEVEAREAEVNGLFLLGLLVE